MTQDRNLTSLQLCTLNSNKMNNSILVQNFIDEIWNRQSFEKMHVYLHPDYEDFSLSKSFPAGNEGTQQWIMETSKSFIHRSVIEGQVTEQDQCIIRIRMELKHIGIWRGIQPTGKEIYTTGYRQFRFRDGKIIAHWALIDGATIEKQLKQ